MNWPHDDLEQPVEPIMDRICLTCANPLDRYGYCPCDPVAVVCAYCDRVIVEGRGLLEWEAGETNPTIPVSHGCCASCLKEQINAF